MVEREAHSSGTRSSLQRRRTVLLVLAAVTAAALVSTWALTRSSAPDELVVASEAQGSGGAADAGPGEIRVQLEEVDGAFIEGFEVGLRFETGDSELIASTLWSDFVASTGRTDMDAYYDSVLSQSVPAGTVRVSAEVNIGAGPPPSTPDLGAELPCLLVVEVDPGAVVAVEATFSDAPNCLRLVPGSDTSNSTTTTTTTAPPVVAAAPTTTVPSVATGPAEGMAVDVGSSHYVDVDLACQEFELAGVWVLVEGDTTTWQPPGERHEGGTFTVERPGYGRFAGNANGDRTATFRLLTPNEPPACIPVPRGGQ
jgi:hypothetical protein